AAVDVLRIAKSTTPDYELYRQLWFYLRNLDPEHEDEALASFTRARELNPSDPETLGMMGGLYKRQGRFAEAREAYDAGARLSPSNLYMRVNQAAMAVLGAPNGWMTASTSTRRFLTLLRAI